MPVGSHASVPPDTDGPGSPVDPDRYRAENGRPRRSMPPVSRERIDPVCLRLPTAIDALDWECHSGCGL